MMTNADQDKRDDGRVPTPPWLLDLSKQFAGDWGDATLDFCVDWNAERDDREILYNPPFSVSVTPKHDREG